MGWNIAFDRIKEERKMLSFFKIFHSADLSSERMRALPYNFISRVSKEDFSYKMVIRAQWGKTWDVEISKNPQFYYIGRRGWDQFVSDNALGENEFITFTHRRKMIFHVNIYEQNGKEMLKPRKLLRGEVKKEQGESSYKDVKHEVEETGESPGRSAFPFRSEEPKSYKKKMKSKKVEKDQSSKKKKKKKSYKVVNDVPEFKITIRKSYLKFLAIPKQFVDDHIPSKSKIFTVHHPNGIKSWKVLCLVREIRTIFSGGYSKLAREFPLSVGDKCSFKLIKPFEFLLVISRKAREETHYMAD